MLKIDTYSDKSFVIRGEETKEYKDKLKELGGKWNSNLKDGGGWIFSNNNKNKVQDWVNTLVDLPKEDFVSKKYDLNLQIYSEKSFVIRGEDTKNQKDKLKELGGKWNSNLKNGGGWIFSNNNKDKVEEWLKSLNIEIESTEENKTEDSDDNVYIS